MPHLPRLSCVLALLGLSLATARADVLVHADGRRSVGDAPRRDGQGRWTVEQEGRRVVLPPGDVVAVVAADGRETDLLPVLADAQLDAATEWHLATLRDKDAAEGRLAAEALGARPTRAVFEALVALADGQDAGLRGRALGALLRLRTRESVRAAVQRVLAERDRTQRRVVASELFTVQEIVRRADLGAEVRLGLADKDAAVRVVFALLAPRDLAEAAPVLRADGLGSSDHHVRESAALELGHRGDPAAERVLVSMLARTKLSASGDVALDTRLLVAEHVEVCAALGCVATKGACAALQKALRSPHAEVQKAAEAALAVAAPK